MIWSIVKSVDGELKIALGLTPEDIKALFEENCYASLNIPIPDGWNGSIVIFGGKDDDDVLSQMPNLGSAQTYIGPKTGRA